MKYRTYNNNNICKRTGYIFATYCHTKKEAKAHQAVHGGVIERLIGGNWVAC